MKKLPIIFVILFLFSCTAQAGTWWNKETRNGSGSFSGIRSISKPTNWNNPKNNFTQETPPTQTIKDGVPCDWDGSAWVLDDIENQNNTNRKTSIQAFIDSPFNNITLEQANDYIDYNVIDLDTTKETLKKIVRFQIGLREILRNEINHKD